MHQTAQRNQLASTPGRVDNRRDSFKSETNNRVATNAVAIRTETVHAKKVSGDQSEHSQASRMSAKPYPYQPGHQVELLHLQAEADALMLKLQTVGQKQTASF